jgi:gliding motility-associated-like protein
MLKKLYFLFFLVSGVFYAQEITSFQQFNGRYDYIAIGNTLNPAENNLDGSFCQLLSSSSADLNLDPSNEIIAAYLFWAGSGQGDLEITLNNQSFIADQTYNVFYDESPTSSLPYFSCTKDITSFIISEGNTTYTLSDLDVSSVLTPNTTYCGNRTNFAGWSIYIIYKNDILPLNQVNLFVGLDIINRFVPEKEIIIDNLNVLDNQGAKIGFLAWEGDNALNFGESLLINNNILSNPPLNNSDNAFNGTNTFTNSTTLYNMDLDVYNIENNINVGDTQATIKLTTGGVDNNGFYRADLIILNNIITVLNSQVPDASIENLSFEVSCNSREVALTYDITNYNATESLPSNTPISIYADNVLIGQSETFSTIAIGDFETHQENYNIPSQIPLDFNLTIAVDDDGTGNGIVLEILETNNIENININLFPEPLNIPLELTTECDETANSYFFNLETALSTTIQNTYLSFSYFESLEDLNQQNNEILNITNFETNFFPNTVYVKAEKNTCFDVITITLNVNQCPPFIPSGISPNNDGLNDVFNITFYSDTNTDYDLLIYNRYGTLTFKGSQNQLWDGTSNRGINKGEILPVGTYYYVLNVKTENQKQITGWVYLNR